MYIFCTVHNRHTICEFMLSQKQILLHREFNHTLGCVRKTPTRSSEFYGARRSFTEIAECLLNETCHENSRKVTNWYTLSLHLTFVRCMVNWLKISLNIL